MTIFLETDATATIDGDSFKLREGSACKLDSGAVPYATAQISLPFLSDDLLDYLDPRDGVRVPVLATTNGISRTFDLGLRTRSVDHVSKTVTLDLASDEALLQDHASLTEDKGARAHQASVRAVVNYVLGKIGAALEAGTDDANVTAYWAITNLLPNPEFGVNTSGWIAGFGGGSLTRVAITGGFGLRWVATAGTSNIVAAPTVTTFGITPGRSYVFVIEAYGTPRSARCAIQWFGSDGQVVVSESFSPAQTLDGTGIFKRFTVVATAPAGASHANPFFTVAGTTGTDAFIAKQAMFYEGNEVVNYFSGATADTATYDYAWTGTAHGSASTRTPIVKRLPELFTWKPGVSAWDFLNPITSSAGLVLWCDEARDWRIATPEHRTIVTLVSVSPENTRDGDDTLSRDDTETYVTGVVVHYSWKDADGIDQEAYDTAGTTAKVLLVELARPFPGPGLAAAMLARRQGTGRRQGITAAAPIGTTPGMTVQVSLPGAPDTVGRVADVEFDLFSGFLTIGAAGLVDIIPGSVAALPGTVDALVGTVDSL